MCAVQSIQTDSYQFGEKKKKQTKKTRQLCEIKQLFGVEKRTWLQAYSMSPATHLHCQICVQLSCYLQHLAAIWTDKVLSLFSK